MYSLFEIVASTDPVVVELVDLDVLKLELGITATTGDDLLEQRITRTSNQIADYCGRPFGLTEAIETFVFDTLDSPLPQKINLRLTPVREVVSIAVDGVALTEDDDWAVDLGSGQIVRVGGTWSGRVAVQYIGGYDLPDDAPAALASACIEDVRVKRAFSGVDPTIRQTSHGDQSVGFYSQPLTSNGGLSQSAADLVRMFKIPGMA